MARIRTKGYRAKAEEDRFSQSARAEPFGDALLAEDVLAFENKRLPQPLLRAHRITHFQVDTRADLS
jgi:hypothetical protein